jgi:3-oxoacyl-[acyl-carrier-protein] synthase III
MPAYINRLSSFLPHAPIPSEDMERVLGQIGDKPSRVRRVILRSNGIKSRHYVIDPESGAQRFTNAQISASAVRGLVGNGFSLANLDVLACGTSSPDQIMPGHAVMVHGELGEAVCEAVSFSGICCSGISALKYAYLAVASGQAKHAVACASEVASTFMRPGQFVPQNAYTDDEVERRPEVAFDRDFLRWMLSDGAGAVLIAPEPATDGVSLRIDWIEMQSYAHEQPACMYCGAEREEDGRLRGWREYGSIADASAAGVFTIKQDVRQLNDNIVRVVIDQALTEVIRRRGLAASDVTWFVPHYSSEYFKSMLSGGLTRIGFHIPEERWFSNLSNVGNAGAASAFLMLDELVRSGRMRNGDTILLFVPESGRFSVAYALLTVCLP